LISTNQIGAAAMTRYDSLSEVQSNLLQKKIIDLAGEVDQDMFRYVREALIRLTAQDYPEIEILISSKGGDCDIGLDIYDLILNYPGKTIGKAFGFANSMATVILQACDIRLAAKHAFLLIHNPRTSWVSWDELHGQKKLIEKIKFLDVSRSAMLNSYLDRTGRTRRQIEKAMRQAKNMTAEEALKFGLIDGIIKPEKQRKDQTK